MEVKPYPEDLKEGREVIAIVTLVGLGSDGETFLFQVDCVGIVDVSQPQAFAVSVPVEDFSDVQRLMRPKHSRVILSESRERPEYLELVDDTIVHCDVTRHLGESRKSFEYVA